ncbi:MAG: adenylyl-sulfate kinase [Rhodospirillales bacterium]
MVIWIIGLSAAGKSTVAREVVRLLGESHIPSVLLDGDLLRDVWGQSLGYDLDSRRENADRTCRLGRMLEQQGICVVTAILSLFPESRLWNRQNLNRYFEVYLDVPMEELKRRDPKGLYAKAERGEMDQVVGLDLTWQPPEAPDLHLNAPAVLDTPQALARQVIDRLPPEWLVAPYP